MSNTASPLRYPGGKSSLILFMKALIETNQFQRYHYAEPYAGGAGLALSLLYSGEISEIHINDIDPSIWSFWYSTLNYNQELIRMIEQIDVNMDEWHKQREIQLKKDCSDPLSLGFSTFFLNRTNRSGIILKAGVIGGKKQEGNYKIDCRFNKNDLIQRIKRVSKYKSQIHLTHDDAVEFMNAGNALPDKTIFCIDPPYFNKGSSLYTNFYRPEDHEAVSQAVKNLKQPWLVTYDNADKIKQLYAECNQTTFNINYSLQTKRLGTEMLITSDVMYVPHQIHKKRA